MKQFTILDKGVPREAVVSDSGDRITLTPDALSRALGWELKPQGLCKDGACYPVPASGDLLVDGAVDLATFATLVGRPLALDLQCATAALGTAAASRADSMESLIAPDFTLPDLDGRMHTLSEHLGKKVFLVAHASW